MNRDDQFELVVPETKSTRMSVIGALVSRRSTVSPQAPGNAGSPQPVNPANAAVNARVLAAVRAYVKPLPASESLGFQNKLAALSQPQALNQPPERFAGLVGGVVSSASQKIMDVTPESQQLALQHALTAHQPEIARWVSEHTAGDGSRSNALAQLVSQEVLERAQALLHEDRVSTAERVFSEIMTGRSAQAVADGVLATEIQQHEASVARLAAAHEVHKNTVRALLERVDLFETKNVTVPGYLTAQLRVAQLAMRRAQDRLGEAQALLGMWTYHRDSNPPELQREQREAPLRAQASEAVFLAKAGDYVARAWDQLKADQGLVFSEATATPQVRALRGSHLAQVAALEQRISDEDPSTQPLALHLTELRLRAGTPGFHGALARTTRIAEQLKALGPELSARVAKEAAGRLRGLQEGLDRLPPAGTPVSEPPRDGRGAAPQEFQPAIAAVSKHFSLPQARALSHMRLLAQVPPQDVATIAQRVVELVALGLSDDDPAQVRRAVNSLGNPTYLDLIERALLETSQPPSTPERQRLVQALGAALVAMGEEADGPGAREKKSSPGS